MRRKSESPSGILGRGSACLSCRRRKLKCTGTRPACEQCSQMKRVHECQYDDSSKKSRTQLLREKVIFLEAKLRDLENESSLYTPQGMSPLSLSDSSGSSESLIEPMVSLSAEMHNTLIQTFIRHRRQCCFYTDTSRFDSSSSATIFQRSPPNSSLMSAIYLVGSLFSHAPLPHDLQSQLLEQALCSLSRSVHNQEHLMDAVQASCLIAQYFFFNHRVMEGNRHLLAAKRMAYDLGLYSLSEPDIPTLSDYAYDSTLHETTEKSAVFWQVFMVDKFWSVTNHIDVILPDRSPYRYATTPLPVKEGSISAMNSPIYALFDDHFHVNRSSLSTVAFKAMASSIFDRSLRIHNSWPRDGGVWAFHFSAEVALKNLSSWVDPFSGRGSSVSQEPYFDTDLYTIHTLILTSTIHLHFDNMGVKNVNAANELLELINFLNPGDYCYLDPILATCWYSIIVSFRRIAPSNRGDSYTNTFLCQGIDNLVIALRNMGRYVPVAGFLMRDLDLEGRRMAPIITPRYSKELHVVSELEHRSCGIVR